MRPRGLRPRWTAAAELIAENRDVLDERPTSGEAPRAITSRGWVSFLDSLDDLELERLEVDGLAAHFPERTPASLLAFAARARAVSELPALAEGEGSASTGLPRRRETPRKRAQVDAFAALVVPLAETSARIVDVGSGHGHLARDLAERLALPVLGLERDATLASRARRLHASAAPSFAVTDVLEDGLSLSQGDCVVGLHACGELGDLMVERAGGVGASVALVSCCLQKRRAPSRRSLAAPPELAERLDLPRRMLGLSNLVAREHGVEATRSENLAARERRLALNRLLSRPDAPLRLGAEIDGLNRRVAQKDLETLVVRAFALRNAAVPSDRAISEAAAWARVEGALARRRSLPRAMLARALEVFVLLDRGVFLEDRGYAVSLGTAFAAEVSARNLALVAKPAV